VGSNYEFQFIAMYMGILDSHKTSFQAVLRHVRDEPQKPFLFHCTGMLAPMKFPGYWLTRK
jgi:hypothetical protein